MTFRAVGAPHIEVRPTALHRYPPGRKPGDGAPSSGQPWPARAPNTLSAKELLVSAPDA
ncbi:hypothetical protein SUDANB120_01664 [Streptomyces sp. enrichment culture]